MCMIFFSFLHQCFAESFFFVNFSCQIKIPYFLLQMIFLVFQYWFHCYSIFILKSYFCKIWKSCSSLIGIQHGFCKYFLMVRPAVITFCCSIYIQIDFGNILLTYISLDQIHSGDADSNIVCYRATEFPFREWRWMEWLKGVPKSVVHIGIKVWIRIL